MGKENKAQLDQMQKQMTDINTRIVQVEGQIKTEGTKEKVSDVRKGVDFIDYEVTGWIIDFADAILPNNTKEIADLKTGKVWLQLLNRMFNRNYKPINPRKNYNNCIKMLQANDVDAGFILESLDKILEGEEETHIDIAYEFRDVLNQCEAAWETCNKIEADYQNIGEIRDGISAKENKMKRRKM